MPDTSSQILIDHFRMQITSNGKTLTRAEERQVFALKISRMIACSERNRLPL